MLRKHLKLIVVALVMVVALPVLSLSAAPGGKVKLGAAYYGDLVYTGDGDGAEVLLYEDGNTRWLSVTVWLDTTGPLVGTFYGYSSKGGPLPLGAKRVGDLVGRSFEILDASGRVVVSSELPKVRGSNTQTFGGDFVRGEAPFRLRVADKKGTLQDIAQLEPLAQQ